jgi:hypothetical protein
MYLASTSVSEMDAILFGMLVGACIAALILGVKVFSKKEIPLKSKTELKAQTWGVLNRKWLIRVVVSLFLLIIVWWYSAYPRGMIVAWFDLVCGHYEVKTFGYPARWSWEYRLLIYERYGVKIKAVAGCVVDEELVWYVDGYNSVSYPRIRARFGKDIFAECRAEAKASWDKSHHDE